LSSCLSLFGISGFVAHEDIEPTNNWEDEIILALNTMDACLAILTPGFEISNWTSQEVGMAVGRGSLVLPVKKGLDPFGFIGRYQALPGNDRLPFDIATDVARILASHQQTRLVMAHGFVTSLEKSESFADSRTLISRGHR
jgi:hypothetical protein